MTRLEMTDKEKAFFFEWLQQREKAILEEVEIIKNLRIKLESKSEVITQPDIKYKRAVKTIQSKTETESSTWVNIIKKELGHFSHPVPSGEIVKRLLQKPLLAEKGKRFITKAVTSKLWLLQERGEVTKTREDGRYIFSLKK